ncbi:MAG: GNAT family N-acetyltransferase [Planctomycetaceae bacterium]|mgnify:CR=1 FL=1|nr:GNAT family N-acetyltransferase [Planctomycetaceae bacterium]MBT6486314.1 GNAT family N-acetyltransferase [Planctomycetaceae bacterium]MBT6497553.1 GNAT family N-acetyltransferase [Planctomycetaceae bacterium]
MEKLICRIENVEIDNQQPNSKPDMFDISQATPAERVAALSLLFQAMPTEVRTAQVEEFLAGEERGEISFDGLLLAREGSQIRGVMLSIMQDDGTAFVWPAQAAGDTDRDTIIDALCETVADRVDAGDIVSAQSILETDATADRAALNRNGFRHLADLFYLQRLLENPLPARVDVALEVTKFSASRNEERFARLVEQTYIDTLDCPDFHEHRSGMEALASHRCSGDFAAERWNIYSADGRDVGMLLMNDHPAQDAWEVVYMGVAADARGCGYGRAMLIDGLYAAMNAGRQSVLLAVDSQNAPANRIYDELGFIEVASRAVHVLTSRR